MKLSADLFCLRFNEWTPFQYLDYAQKIGLDAVMFPDPDFFETLEDAYLQEVRAHADSLGVAIEVGMYSICPTSTSFSNRRGTADEQLRDMVRVAHVTGSSAVRCLLGSNADRRTETPLSVHMQNTAATCRAVRAQALEMGIKIAIENHAGDMLGRELKQLVEEAGPDFVGVCIDAGNPLWVGESPFVTLDHLAPYVLMSHIRDTAVWPHPRGAVAQWVAMGDGTIDIERWSRRYMAECPNTIFTLEIITSLAPRVLNYLEADYWAAYQDMPAAEFAQFLQLVHSGSPYTLPTLTANWGALSPEVKPALAAQQRSMLEKSVKYCRDVLGI
ncbi:MAG: sugar phosphate isomerase/epimerase [Caldilineaceae bacterium]|nr:sugar phosphate isomerase/epimerase [Caldilineaceae bacterium]